MKENIRYEVSHAYIDREPKFLTHIAMSLSLFSMGGGGVGGSCFIITVRVLTCENEMS